MDDNKIVELYWKRSESAILETQKKYGNYCFSIANNILPFREDAQECVNDTYFAAWNAIPPNKPSILSAFLGKLTRRIAIDRWRSMNAQKRGGSTMLLVLDELAECIPGNSDPVAEVEAKELAQAINRFLAELPAMQRRIFLMRYFEMATLQDIETSFKITGSKVKSILFRVRKSLRNYLQKEGF